MAYLVSVRFLHAGMIKVVGVVILSAFLLGESSIFTIRYKQDDLIYRNVLKFKV